MPTSLSFTTVSLMMQTISIVASRTSTPSADLCAFAVRAESEINARVANLYTLPFAAAPPLLETIATEIAVQKYLEHRVFTSERRNDSEWPKTFDRAWKTLDKIMKGEMPLVTSSGGIIPVRTDEAEVWSNTKTYIPTFGEDDPSQQFVDDNKLDDLADDRDSAR